MQTGLRISIIRIGDDSFPRYRGLYRNSQPVRNGVFMQRWFASTLFAALAVSMCLGQGASPAAYSGQAAAAGGPIHGVFAVQLAKSLDSKKLKQGDEVEAKVAADIHAADGMTIPRGSKVIGHVTEAKARSKGDPESALGIAFDKIGPAGRPGYDDQKRPPGRGSESECGIRFPWRHWLRRA